MDILDLFVVPITSVIYVHSDSIYASLLPSILAWGFGRFGYLGIVIFLFNLIWLKPTFFSSVMMLSIMMMRMVTMIKIRKNY